MIKHRYLWDTLAKELDTREALVITGARQTGKSTTLKWLLEQIESDNKLFLDLTLQSTRELFESYDAEGILLALKGRGLDFSQRAYIAIDEIQYSKQVPMIVKYLVDHYHIKFFLSGSSAYYLKNHFAESMAGRKLIFEMFPLSFQEYLDFKNLNFTLPNLSEVLSSEKELTFDRYLYNSIEGHYEDYINFGGFPAVVLESDLKRKQQKLDEIFTSYIDLDVEHLADFRSIGNLRKVIALLAVRVGSKVNVNDLSTITGLSRPTIQSYMEFLEKTYLIRLLPVTSKSSDVKTRKQSKVYFVDTGIAVRNADLSGGNKFENTLCHQLQRYGKLSYYDQKGEVDFILEVSSGKRFALEAKESPLPTHLKSLTIRSAQIDPQAVALIGRNATEKFSNYLWGGSIA